MELIAFYHLGVQSECMQCIFIDLVIEKSWYVYTSKGIDICEIALYSCQSVFLAVLRPTLCLHTNFLPITHNDMFVLQIPP